MIIKTRPNNVKVVWKLLSFFLLDVSHHAVPDAPCSIAAQALAYKESALFLETNTFFFS